MQDNRNSLRILQAKSKKNSSSIILYILLGFIAGILFSGIVLILYSKFSNSTNNEKINQSSQKLNENAVQLAHTQHSSAAIENNENIEQDTENNYIPIKDKELSSLFKHQKPNIESSHQQPSSPFENAFGTPNKQQISHSQIPAKVLQKPQTKEQLSESTAKKITKENTLVDDQEIEIPQASVQISVTRTSQESEK
ncbi:hypothetical protein [Acinetobacter sp. ANC 4648]|uniref:hypothetical protein n=1 Tax=Acinetobacter sp. ANC 4648 TaxID=1977875 RepID=UPI000A34C3CE|nr:hypothetical protein [Acinetobacter sp. ANC 4648]OTG85220.1 hypothetical protein B9T27_03160 [Acinetobacter sp. ANC 4648]